LNALMGVFQRLSNKLNLVQAKSFKKLLWITCGYTIIIFHKVH